MRRRVRATGRRRFRVRAVWAQAEPPASSRSSSPAAEEVVEAGILRRRPYSWSSRDATPVALERTSFSRERVSRLSSVQALAGLRISFSLLLSWLPSSFWRLTFCRTICALIFSTTFGQWISAWSSSSRFSCESLSSQSFSCSPYVPPWELSSD